MSTASVEKAVFARVVLQSGVKALVGSRLYPNGQVPLDPTYPLFIQEIQGGERLKTLKGRCGLTKYTVRLTVWSKTQAEMITLMKTADDALDEWKDRLGNVERCALQDVLSEPSPDMPDGFAETRVYAVWFME